MTMTEATSANQKKKRQLQAALDAMLAEVLRPGFFGKVALELTVQDGTIQTVLRKLEQFDR
jgi:hypothetical protein